MSKTSTDVKRRYNEKVYKKITVQIKKEIVEEWEIKLKKDNIPKAEFIRNAIEEYINGGKI